MYTKFYDPTTGAPYYYNKLLNQKSWYKPFLLRDNEDIEAVFHLPDKETEFVALCSYCRADKPAVMCANCDDPFCEACFARLHHAGARKTHTSFEVKSCSECKYQVSGRACVAPRFSCGRPVGAMHFSVRRILCSQWR